MIKKEFLGWFSFAITFILLIWLGLANWWGLTIFGGEVDHARFGTWGQMASAIGTTIAFLIGLWNLYYSRSQYISNEARREKEEKTSVYIWLVPTPELKDNGEFDFWSWRLFIQNSTKSPIYSWMVKFDNYPDHICNYEKRPLNPGENTFKLPFLERLEPNKSPQATLFFTDKANSFWSQSSKGVLSESSMAAIICNHTNPINE